jgi:hypothetical protein
MSLELSFMGISLTQAKHFLEMMREGAGRPPYRMDTFENRFIDDFMSYAGDAEHETSAILKETLHLIWREFNEEYAWISLEDLDPRFSRLLDITSHV